MRNTPSLMRYSRKKINHLLIMIISKNHSMTMQNMANRQKHIQGGTECIVRHNLGLTPKHENRNHYHTRSTILNHQSQYPKSSAHSTSQNKHHHQAALTAQQSFHQYPKIRSVLVD